MSPTPNRLEDEWVQIRERILREWDLLTPDDLDRSRMEYDQIVKLIRKRYGGRKEIIQEAAIRDTLNRILQKLEA
ncbi:MAG: CsbD family protein [Deltaproteobacteria bacterium]|nr:CsbD family protein [Deltaproteobacteria bacterium]